MTIARPRTDVLERRILGGSTICLAGSLAAWTALSALMAVQHMAAMAAICGPAASPHCGWCVSAVVGGVAAIGTAWFGLTTLRAQPAPAIA